MYTLHPALTQSQAFLQHPGVVWDLELLRVWLLVLTLEAWVFIHFSQVESLTRTMSRCDIIKMPINAEYAVSRTWNQCQPLALPPSAILASRYHIWAINHVMCDEYRVINQHNVLSLRYGLRLGSNKRCINLASRRSKHIMF
jgi:hypothetical protein